MIDDPLDVILTDIIEERSVLISDDVYWDVSGQRFAGSFLWNGTSTSQRNLRTFVNHVAERHENTLRHIDAVVAISSSGIAWGTALAIGIDRYLQIIRLAPHKYGPSNQGLERLADHTVILVDNFVGSGETLNTALALLQSYQVRVKFVAVVECYTANACGFGINVWPLFTTVEKLKRLLSHGYFFGVEREVVERIAQAPDSYLVDQAWVDHIKKQLKSSSEPK